MRDFFDAIFCVFFGYVVPIGALISMILLMFNTLCPKTYRRIFGKDFFEE